MTRSRDDGNGSRATKLPADPVIPSDRRTYHVRLVSTRSTAIWSMRWTYPQAELLALKRRTEAAQPAAPVAAGLTVEQLHFNYAISGDRAGCRPLCAFDDGERIYVESPPSLGQGDAPPLFVTSPDGKAELVTIACAAATISSTASSMQRNCGSGPASSRSFASSASTRASLGGANDGRGRRCSPSEGRAAPRPVCWGTRQAPSPLARRWVAGVAWLATRRLAHHARMSPLMAHSPE
ncbi:TrbG/VirB9 family P-type conjugative transfer protein [Sphingobium sp. EP60837]|uniref:TrbG/VirB9 family P-type conjugative transfer protein n=1 Tax=Sphingobium sp. EP60837 TaxID=1855519 RepID=UPI001CECCD85|nr:TrbG/VirB9 family P-type conjugative transfer protein [Sphingobium sp. EP60837]